MTDYCQNFKGKKITVMGLGLLGRGLGVVKFLAECGANLTVTDLKSADDLATSLAELKAWPDIKFVLGEHRLEDFRDCDMVIKSAGVPLDSPFIAEARGHNIPIKMDASLFLELAPDILSIGITGTRGKSTVTHLIFHIIETYLKQNKSDKRALYLGGNVRGLATLPLLKQVKAGDMVVMELDSWQLQGFADSQVAPHIAVFTNLMPDHLNYYKGDFKLYFEDKKNIYRYQKSEDFLVVGKTIDPLIRKSRGYESQLVYGEPIPADWQVKLLGDHNRENISLAVAVAKLLAIPEDVTREAVESFPGVPGRLELIREVDGVKYYNDTTSTMPEATIAALRALSSENIILIGGGNDKNLDYTKYGQEIPKYVKKLILFPGAGTDKIKQALPADFGEKIIDAGSMTEALKHAKEYSGEGDIVLLSPGATSFGPPPGGFKNEFDRGDQFNQEVARLN